MLSIVNVAYPFAPVNADPVGGAEQIVAMLDRALAGAAHSSTLVACAGSQAAMRLVALPSHAGRIDAAARERVAAVTRAAIARCLEQGEVDVVHLHGIDFLDYVPEGQTPVLVTLHLPLPWYPSRALERGATFQRICVSHSQRSGAAEAASWPVIQNGVPLERYHPSPSKGDYALMLGRVCPEKGFELALAAARRAQAELIIAGSVFPYEAHERYFVEVVTPWLDERRRFVGPVAGAAKSQLLARARCLLVASRVHETSSLVAMEALASGTPVVAFRQGALPEIIEHGRTGFLVDTEAEMADAIGAAASLSAEDCRAAAEARFSSAAMSRRYLELYEDVASSTPRPRGQRRPRVSARLEVQALHEERQLAELIPEWTALAEIDSRSTPFQRPEWVLPWSRHLPGGVWNALAIRRAGRLIALLPLRREGTALSLAGAGVSDYLDLICEPGAESAVLEALALHLSARRCDWSSIELDALRCDSPLIALSLPAGWHDELEPAEPSPVRALPLETAPRKLAYYRRRLARAARVEWRAASTCNVAELMRALFELHASRWRSRGQRGVLAHDAVQRFQLEASLALAQSGLLRLHALELDGSIAGVLYAFASHGRVHYYLSGFDPALASFSPGILLVGQAIDQASAEGATEFDFLRGSEPYKYAWGARDRAARRRRIRRA